jgi:hypothetical protein
MKALGFVFSFVIVALAIAGHGAAAFGVWAIWLALGVVGLVFYGVFIGLPGIAALRERRGRVNLARVLLPETPKPPAAMPGGFLYAAPASLHLWDIVPPLGPPGGRPTENSHFEGCGTALPPPGTREG